jgi:phosphoribosylglycinamide formyltransferase-1
MKNIVILISGRGSNMSAIVDACAREGWPARVAAVISNRPGAAGLQWAAERGIATAVVDHKAYGSREAFESALAETIDPFAPDVVALAGFMRILTPASVERYAGRLVNIHPSLLPAFPGLATHRQALDAGVQVHGATVHFVTADLDHGPIIGQAAIAVGAGDTEESLAERLLAQEHRLYPACLRWLVEGRVRIEQGRVVVAGQATRLMGCNEQHQETAVQ